MSGLTKVESARRCLSERQVLIVDDVGDSHGDVFFGARLLLSGVNTHFKVMCGSDPSIPTEINKADLILYAYGGANIIGLRGIIDTVTARAKSNGQLVVPEKLPHIVVVFASQFINAKTIPSLHAMIRNRWVHVLWVSPFHPDFSEEVVVEMSHALCLSVAEVMRLDSQAAFQEFCSWLEQYGDNASIALWLAQHFRHYSAQAIQGLFDRCIRRATNYGKARDNIPPTSFVLSYLGRANKSGPASLPLAAKGQWVKQQDAGTIQVLPYEELIRHLTSDNSDDHAGRNVHIILVDDVIGSGGQLESYFSKFLQRICAVTDKCGQPLQSSRVIEAIKAKRITFSCVFAIGIENEKIREQLQIRNATELRDGSRMACGQIVARNLNVDGVAAVSADVYIGDYTKSVQHIEPVVPLNRERLLTFLEQRRHIVSTREKEHWMQFEPLGWRRSGGLISTYANCPGNTLPLFWGDHKFHRPLFARYFNAFHDGAIRKEDALNQLCLCFSCQEQDLHNMDDDSRKIVAYCLARRTALSHQEVESITGIKVTPQFLTDIDARLEAGEIIHDTLEELLTMEAEG